MRPQGVSKAQGVLSALEQHPNALILAVGDDRTDDDMFAAVPQSGLCIAVGPTPARAQLRVEHPRQVRALLQTLVDRPAPAVA